MSDQRQVGSPADWDWRQAAAAMASIGDDELLEAWNQILAEFLDSRSPVRRGIDPDLIAATGTAPASLQAGFEAVLGGVRGKAAEDLVRRAAGRRRCAPLLVVLAGNLPALVVQPLLPALALRRPVVVKTASELPQVPEALVTALVRRLPALADGVLVRSWRGGSAAVEGQWLGVADQVVAYGGAEAMEQLRSRFSGELLDYGPKLSLAVSGGEDDPLDQADRLVRDIVLFEQRGCLSVQLLFVTERADAWGEALSAALLERSRSWPAPRPSTFEAARVQQARLEAQSRGAWVSSGALRSGTVIVEPEGAEVRPSPGLRTVIVHPLRRIEELPDRLARFAGQLQGVGVSGPLGTSVRRALGELGVSRFAPFGELQSPDASWCNGGRDLLESLA